MVAGHPAAPAGTFVAGPDPLSPAVTGQVRHLVLLIPAVADVTDPHAALRLAGSVLDTVRTALAGPGRRLWIVTRGGASVQPDEPGRPGAAWIRGVVRSLALEHPALQATWLDLPADADDPACAATVWAELGADGPEDEIAWRAGRRHAARLVPVPAPRRRDVTPVRSGAAYLVTGGTRGVGLRLAEYLAAGGAGRVVLAGRSQPGPASMAAVERMRATGTDVVLVRADLTAPGAAARLVRTARAGGLPLAGVVHGAAVAADRLAADVRDADLAKVWTPKVLGAWLLHQAVAAGDTRLDWWVSMSSAAALVGSAGQSAYAAANAWLDAFAGWQRDQGVPAWSVNWGPWARIGGAATVSLGGIASIDPDDGAATLDELLRRAPATIGVLRLDAAAARGAFPEIADLPFFDRLVGAERPAPPSGPAAGSAAPPSGPAAAAVRDLPPAQARAAVRERLADRVAAVLSLSGRPPGDVALPDLGLDSLGAMRVRNQVEADFGVALPVGLLVRGATLADVADHIATALVPPDPGPAPVVAPRDAAERLAARVVGEALGRDAADVTRPLAGLTDTVVRDRVAELLTVSAGTPVRAGDIAPVPSVAQIADLVRAADDDQARRSGLVRPLQPGDGRPALFLAHPAGGTTGVYRDLARLLGDEVAVSGLERIDEGGCIPDRAIRYVDAITAVQPCGPYRLGGWSYGGALAYEIACRLTAKGENVEVLALLDAGLPRPMAADRQAELLRARFTGFGEYLRETYGISVELDPGELAAGDDEALMAHLVGRLADAGVDRSLPPAIVTHQLTSHTDTRSLDRYQPGPYAGPVVLYRTTEPTPWAVPDERYEHSDESRGWQRFCTDLTCVPITAHHLNLLDPPAVAAVAAHLRRLL